MSEPVKDNTPVQDGQFYLLSLPNGGVLSAVQDQWGPDSVRIRVFENTHRQWWKAESNNGGFGFRNRHTGKLLGTNENRDIAASANAVDDWERNSSLQTLRTGKPFLSSSMAERNMFSTEPRQISCQFPTKLPELRLLQSRNLSSKVITNAFTQSYTVSRMLT